MIKVKLSDLAHIKMGQSPQGETCNEYGDGIPLLNGPSEFTSFYPIPKQYTNDPKKICQESDILFCVRGSTTGRMNWADKKYAIGRGLASISHKKCEEFNHFLKYLIEYNLDSILKLTSGSTFPNLTNDNLALYEFYVPEIEVQKKISSFLSNLDSKIELNNRINTELEAMAKTLYDYWFVQFDFADANGKPYKTSGGKMVWNAELKREIPEGWAVKTLLDIANFVNGLACQKFRPKENESSYRVIKIREMGTGFTENSEFVSRNIPEKVVIHNGDILFSWSATLDVKIWTGRTGALNQHIFKITSKDFPKSYYYFELLNYLEHFKMQAELRKTTMGHITQDHLKQSRITIPPSDLIHKLDEILKPILEKKVKLEEENQELASVRDWLLPMLMNGQVRVSEVVEELGMVAEKGERYGK